MLPALLCGGICAAFTEYTWRFVAPWCRILYNKGEFCPALPAFCRGGRADGTGTATGAKAGIKSGITPLAGVLQLPQTELEGYLQEAVLSNPLLEMELPQDFTCLIRKGSPPAPWLSGRPIPGSQRQRERGGLGPARRTAPGRAAPGKTSPTAWPIPTPRGKNSPMRWRNSCCICPALPTGCAACASI